MQLCPQFVPDLINPFGLLLGRLAVNVLGTVVLLLLLVFGLDGILEQDAEFVGLCSRVVSPSNLMTSISILTGLCVG